MSWKHLLSNFGRTLVPTLAQVLGAVFLALAILIAMQSQMILSRLGISQAAIQATHDQVVQRFGIILESQIVSNIALVTFWATIGLVTYLICWGVYNVIIEARNEVTLETQYTNRQHWGGAVETLALKAVAAVLLMVLLSNFGYGLSFWSALAAPVMEDPSASAVTMVAVGVLGLAAQLYLLLVLIQLTITPWYRADRLQDE